MDDGRGKRVAGRWRMHIFFIDFLLRNHGDCRFLIPTGRESNLSLRFSGISLRSIRNSDSCVKNHCTNCLNIVNT